MEEIGRGLSIRISNWRASSPKRIGVSLIGRAIVLSSNFNFGGKGTNNFSIMQEKREKSAVFGVIFMEPTSNAGIKEERTERCVIAGRDCGQV